MSGSSTSFVPIRADSVDEIFKISSLMFLSGIKKVGEDPRATYLFKTQEESPLFYARKTEDATSPDRGNLMLEYSTILSIENPRDRLVYSKPIDIYNLVGLWFYMLRGSADLRDMEFYNPLTRKFVDEETSISTLRGNWGERLFASGGVTRAVNLLRANPNTRRAVVPVFDIEDVGFESRNLPCLISVQFAHKGKLDMFSSMRAQAAIGVLPYDLFLLTMLHEYVAVRADHDLGTYHHIAPLIGIREREIPIINDMVRADNKKISAKSVPMEKMPVLEPGMKSLLLDCERRIRGGNPIWEKDAHLLPEYWQSFLAVSMSKWHLNRKQELWQMRLHEAEHAFPKDFIERCCKSIVYGIEHPK